MLISSAMENCMSIRQKPDRRRCTRSHPANKRDWDGIQNTRSQSDGLLEYCYLNRNSFRTPNCLT
ncbi:hypothetical protein JOE65_001401 [Arthrobacter roseus]|nr:hypothetical protein [Arthrobacter roseus]